MNARAAEAVIFLTGRVGGHANRAHRIQVETDRAPVSMTASISRPLILIGRYSLLSLARVQRDRDLIGPGYASGCSQLERMFSRAATDGGSAQPANKVAAASRPDTRR